MLELRFKLPEQEEQSVPLDQFRMVLGTLLSNQVVLRAPMVEPIHGLLEAADENNPESCSKWILTDLGSEGGIQVNGNFIEVEATLAAGDKITVGAVELVVVERGVQPVMTPPPPPPRFASTMTSPEMQPAVAGVPPVVPGRADKGVAQQSARGQSTLMRQPEASVGRAPESTMPGSGVLFSPKNARPSGDVVEAVAFWGDTVLDVDYFHPSIKGNEQLLIGDPTKDAHLIAAGPDNVSSHALASISSSGFRLRLLPGMTARLRRGGKVEKVAGPAKVNLDRRDIALVQYGPVNYFLMNIRPPALEIPKRGLRDPLFATILGFGLLLFVLFLPLTFIYKPKPDDKKPDDPWTIVNLPEAVKPPEPTPKPKVEIKEVKVPPPTPKAPPPPKPVPVKAAKPVEREKVEQPKPVEKPVEKKTEQIMAENKQTQADKPKVPTPPTPKPADKPLDKLSKSAGGMPSADAKKPDFKYAGPQNNKPLGASGGEKGSGMNQKGGERKGNQAASVMGVEGVKNNKASGPNLDKLGLGAGKVFDKSGPSALYTNMRSSAGGAGGGMGSGSKTYGLGGVGNGKSLGLAGSGGAVNNFGSGSGGLLGGQGGLGGLGGAGGGRGAGFGGGSGHGRANVDVPGTPDVAGGGLSPQEIVAVVRANLNQIRHCYEQLLARSPSASGKLAVNWTIGVSGSVTSVSIVESSFADAQMKGCVTSRIQRWKFPAPRGGQAVEVNYPWTLTPI
jgi:TonB family protein